MTGDGETDAHQSRVVTAQALSSSYNHHLYISGSSPSIAVAVTVRSDELPGFSPNLLYQSSLALNCIFFTIASPTHSTLERDILSTQIQSDSTLEVAAVASRRSATSTPALTQRVPTDSTVLSLVPATRSRSELEQGSSEVDETTPSVASDPAFTRARKRQRIGSSSSPSSANSNSISNQPPSSISSHNMMRLADTDLGLPSSASSDASAHAGPSSLAGRSFDGMVATNGHTNGFGPMTNGTSGTAAVMGNGLQKHSNIAKVSLPGTRLYEDSSVDREEFIRLVIQSLRDIGYVESAATLEAESGYAMESPEVSHFRQYILDGMWGKAEVALEKLVVDEEEGIWDAKFLISRQKYLELVEARKPTSALQVLRNELTPLNVDPDQLHMLSSLIMCTDPEDLRRRADWDGASGASRYQLLAALHDYIPSAVMIPQRRFATLLHQAEEFQRQQCIYHNPPPNSRFSLYSDHRCSKNDFPRITTTILEVHTDEVWNIEWSHDGNYLASASKDRTAIIWRRGSNSSSSSEWTAHLILRDHQYPVGCLAWSLDDSVLLTSSEHIITMWNTRTGVCIRTLDDHTETVTTLSWLPDGSGFVSGGLDRKITIWNSDGKVRDTWGAIPIRLTGFSITPDARRLVAVGMEHTPYYPPSDPQARDSSIPPSGGPQPPTRSGHRLMIFDFATKQLESSVRLEGELMSITTSPDSQHLLINYSPNEIQLWELQTLRIVSRYKDLKQSRHVIRSCFGGNDGNFVVSGSEDAMVYVWHRDSGALLESLSGHGDGSVNSVAWNPTNERMFASCSDDGTIRIWEAPSHGVYVAEPPSEAVQPSSASTLVEKGKGKPKQSSDGNEGSTTPLRTWFDHDQHLI